MQREAGRLAHASVDWGLKGMPRLSLPFVTGSVIGTGASAKASHVVGDDDAACRHAVRQPARADLKTSSRPVTSYTWQDGTSAEFTSVA